MKNLTFYLMLTLFLLAACGGAEKNEQATESNTESQTEESTSTSSLQKEIQDVQREAEKAMKQLQSGEGSKEVVDYKELKAVFPESMAGLERTSLTGQKAGMMGFKISTAEAEYINEDRSRRIKGALNDTAGIGAAMMSMAAWTNMEYERESDTGFERTTKCKGYPCLEKYDNTNQSAEVAIVINERFVLTLESRGIPFEDLKAAVDKLSLKRISKLG